MNLSAALAFNLLCGQLNHLVIPVILMAGVVFRCLIFLHDS
ncbi:MAG TPA: hypothetical protein PKK09_03765 [Anaerolineaceae bacterium]|nr:hypothetical protein [Anaerolineaceae bacterium]HOQ69210.1 hypothetical protein [Anaerolineaceae bacterium]